MRLQITKAKNGFFVIKVGSDEYIAQHHDDQDASDKELGLQLRAAYDEWEKAGGKDAPEPRRPRTEVVDDEEFDDDPEYEGSFLDALGEAGKLIHAASHRFPSRHRRKPKPESKSE